MKRNYRYTLPSNTYPKAFTTVTASSPEEAIEELQMQFKTIGVHHTPVLENLTEMSIQNEIIAFLEDMQPGQPFVPVEWVMQAVQLLNKIKP